MLTLGIHDGHTATACLLEDGRVVACLSEERLNREKEWSGFPALAIERCLEMAGKQAGEVDAVGVCSLLPQIGHDGYHRPGMHKRVFGWGARLLPESLLQSSRNVALAQALGRRLFKGRREDFGKRLSQMGIATERVSFFEHHELHAATAYYPSWYRDRPTLVVTLDGSGDAVCATVNIGENGRLSRLEEVFNYNSICEFYTRVTQHLGMKPMSHEYKLMGMAPYAGGYGRDEVRDCFRGYFGIDPKRPMSFLNTSGVWKWQFAGRLERDLRGRRFDIIAGAAQDVFEEVCLEWVRNTVRETGIGNLALSGGGFMNVKLNYLISQLPEVESLFVFPSCGDESNPVGAAILAALESGLGWEEVEPLPMIDWGPSFTNDECERALEEELPAEGFKVERTEDPNSAVAEHIAGKKIVGRFRGRMEWGARSLGHRSIVADPRDPSIIHTINRAIKMRDFWMPFAPAILESHRERYLDLRPDYRSPFMTIAPDTKEPAWSDIAAGLQPFDRSARAQVVDAEYHPDFHDLLSKFESLTGVGGVLNTSFNLHGDPIVCSPQDAIRTFLNSDLDVLQLEDFIVEK